MEFLQLKYFLAAAKTENFSEVARQHYVPASTVSKSISLLERELGVSLFERKHNRLTLSEAGKIYYRYAFDALAGLEEGAQRARGIKNSEISLLVRCARRVLTHFIGDFKRAHPEALLRINYSGAANFDQYDLCICEAHDVPDGYQSVPLFEEPYGVAARVGRLQAKGPLRLAHLQDEQFITLTPEATLTRDTLRFCRAAGFEPHVNILCEDPLYVRSYVEMGLGISLFPVKSWHGLFSGDVALYGLDDPSIYRQVMLCCRPVRRSDLCGQFIRELPGYLNEYFAREAQIGKEM